jgi:hypothetical protein
MRYADFEDSLFLHLGRVAEIVGDFSLNPDEVAERSKLEYQAHWVQEAVKSLEAKGYLNVEAHGGFFEVRLTGRGWDTYQDLADVYDFHDDDTATEAVPASDRVVRLDHNSAAYLDADQKLSEVVQAIGSNNEYAATDPEDFEQRIAELESGQRLLKAVRVRVNAITETLIKPLKWLLVKFGESLIGALITIAITALAALFGISL